MTSAPPERLRRRADFLAANGGGRVATAGFVLLVRRRADNGAIRVGFTVTKKIGGAVVRNRLKRRLRALARAVLPAHGLANADHVLIGREGGLKRDYATMQEELTRALGRLAA